MGEHNVGPDTSPQALRQFMQRVLVDLRALERMIDEGWIESGVRRIGAEQELCLVDRESFDPAHVAMEVLEACDESRLTTELGRFNLELNLDPEDLGGDCLRRMELQLVELIGRVRDCARAIDADVVLAGILPTLSKNDLTLDGMTPMARYRALNEALVAMRGRQFQLRLKGIDELSIVHDNVMLEACNTSFQIHFQVGADEFARLYNIAQLVTAPVLAAAANSPLLFGKRLWRETRIGLFQLSMDTRLPSVHTRQQTPRVRFGRKWLERSVLEIFQEDIARFRLLLATDVDEDPEAELAAGRPPKLSALRLHNGTVYRWNRPCYGVSDGKAHLRIENRALPAGPTPVDEVANAAFWFGLMKGVDEHIGDVTQVIHFDQVGENFLAAARFGLDSLLGWPGHERQPAAELIVESLVPLAREGLQELGIDDSDVGRYLGVIEERVRRPQNGAHWQLRSLAAMSDLGSQPQQLRALTAASIARQRDNTPVHQWEPARLEEAGEWQAQAAQVTQFMTTDLFTVNQDELVDVVACVMDWEHIRHVPVEDNENRLVGLVTHRHLLRLLARRRPDEQAIPVSEVMIPDPVTCSPEESIQGAIRTMREHKIGCLPVVKDGLLVGVVTERDFMDIAAALLEERFR